MKARELRELLRADLSRLTLQVENATESSPDWLMLFNPRIVPVLLVRLARYCYLSRWLRAFSPIFTWLNVIIFGIEFTAKCEVGPGLLLPHTSGTVVGASKIGANVTIFQGVTLGAKFADMGFNPATRPALGDNVVVGAGAKILGGIVIGDRAVIAANSLVIDSVGNGVFMIGVPAVARGQRR